MLVMKKLKLNGLGWISGKVSKIDNQNGKYTSFLISVGIKSILSKIVRLFKDIENNTHMYFVHSYEFVPE